MTMKEKPRYACRYMLVLVIAQLDTPDMHAHPGFYGERLFSGTLNGLHGPLIDSQKKGVHFPHNLHEIINRGLMYCLNEISIEKVFF